MNIPDALRAGDTLSWTESLADYPASAGWTLAFVLSKSGQALITITASASGDNYAVSIPAATSRSWVAGIYSWQAYVYKASGTPPVISEKYTLEFGHTEILPDITQASSASDLRSHAKKVLDAIEALIEGKASADVLSYSIGGRSISKMMPEELIKWRNFYKTEYERELEAENIARGLDSPRRVGVRFRRI